MNRNYDFDRQMTAWLTDEAPPKAPTGVLDGALDRATTVSQRPSWLLPERWIPMQATMRLATVSRGALYAMFILILAVLLAVAVFVVGQQHRLPPPVGVAANGVIADDSHGMITLISPTGEAVRPLTDQTEIALAPAFSPNGNRVAFWSIPRPANVPTTAPIGDQFVRLASSPASIVIVDVASGTRSIVATGLAMNEPSIQWSHASDAIAYVTAFSDGSEHGSVHVASATGSPIATVELADSPSWSPDDKTILVRRWGQGVFAVDRDGSNLRQLSHAYGIDDAFGSADWSPDGSKVAFFAGGLAGYSVYVVDADGSNETLVAKVENGAEALWPRFSPDGARLAYLRTVSNEPGGTTNLAVANVDGSGEREFANPVWQTNAGWSPDGRYLMSFEGDPDVQSIVLVEATSGAVQRIPTSGSANVSWQRLAP